MAKLSIQGGATDVTLNVFICDSTAAYPLGLTGLAWNTAGLSCYYVRQRTAAAALALVNVAVAGAHTDGGFVEIDAANMPGMYRLDLSDVVIATGVRHVTVMLEGAANMVPCVAEIDLDCELGATQGGVAFAGQVTIAANVAGQGALDIRNSNAAGYGMYNRGGTAGYGQYNYGGDRGMYNFGGTGPANGYGMYNSGGLVGQYNLAGAAAGNGQYNSGANSGQYNTGNTGQYNTGILTGQYNIGITGQGNEGTLAGQYNSGTGAASYGQQNNGVSSGQYNAGTGPVSYGIQAAGTTAPLGPNTIDAQSIALSADAEIGDAVLDEVVEGTYTLRQLIRLMASALYGKVSGGGTTTVTFRDTGDTINRIVATVTNKGNRTAVTLDAT